MRLAQVAAIALALAASLAHAGPIIMIQEGADYAPGQAYSGTADTYTQVVGRGPWGNAGGFKESAVINRHARNSLLVRFGGLDAALGGAGVTDGSQILDAKLMLHVTATAYDPTKAGMDVCRMTRDWAEGAANWSFSDFSTIDGCNNASFAPPRLVSAAAWSQPDAVTYPNVWATAVSSKAMMFSKDQTYHPGFSAEVASVADCNSTADSFYSTSGTLYVNTAKFDTTCRYWLAEDLWPVPGMALSGSFGVYFENTPGLNDAYDTTDVRQIPAASGVGEWMELDVTSWVRDWFADDASNLGMLLRANGGDFDGPAFAFSEYDADTSLRPKLVVTIPEPASALLLLLGVWGLKRRRRK